MECAIDKSKINCKTSVCVCVHVYVVYKDTNLYNDKEKVIYEDIFSLPIIQKACKS